MSGDKREPMTPDELEAIIAEVAAKFRCFGGGNVFEGNPIAASLRNGPTVFALGVSASDVVIFVLMRAEVDFELSEERQRTAAQKFQSTYRKDDGQ